MGREINDRCSLFGLGENNSWLQYCANLKLYSLTAGLVVLGVTGSYSYMSAVLTTTQYVYSFSATELGVWYAMFEVGAILSNIITSYFFTKKHIPRVLCLGLIALLIGCLLHGLPHFFVTYEEKLKSTDADTSADDLIKTTLCHGGELLIGNVTNTTSMMPETFANLTTMSAEVKEHDELKNSTIVIIIYCIAAFINGAGYAPFWSLGLVYIHNNVKEEHESSKFIAIILGCYTIGPVIGFGAGAIFLEIYVTLGDTYLTSADSTWIGAWWLGYIVFAAFLGLFIIPFAMFPYKMPYTSKEKVVVQSFKKISTISSSSTDGIVSNEKINEPEDHDPTEDRLDEKPDKSIRDIKQLLPTFWKLLTNPLYMCEVGCACFSVYYLSGWIGYLPKYFEEQFHLTASQANIYGGLLPPLFSCFSIMAGGFVASKLKMSVTQDARLLFFSCLISTIVLIPTVFLNCDQSPVQEIPANISALVDSCSCDEHIYDPICYQNKSYMSACLSGCGGYYYEDETIMYTGCFGVDNATVPAGACREEGTCYAPYLYSVCAIFTMASFMFSGAAAVNIIMRCVEEEDRSIALGLQSSINSLLAWIPAPIAYGALIDNTCKIWEYPNGSAEDPEWYGYCMEYHNEEYRASYLGLAVAMNTMMTVSAGAGWAISKMKRYQEVKDSTGNSSTTGNQETVDKLGNI